MNQSIPSNMILNINQEISIEAAPDDVYRGLIDHLTKLHAGPENEPIPMVLEEWPGGRWFREFEGGAGHLWGFVQAIKPPSLIEIYGPLFMSFAVANNVQIRLEPTANGTTVSLKHQVLGAVPDDYREGIGLGWSGMLDRIKTGLED